MKMTRVIISYVLLTAAITVNNTHERPMSSAVIRAADCCGVPCPPLCPPSQTRYLMILKGPPTSRVIAEI
jgi:hypothetical protein